MVRSEVRQVLTIGGVLSLAGCISHSSSEVVTSMTDDLRANATVSEVRITSLPADIPPDFDSGLKAALQSALATCTSGKHPLRLEVAVTRFTGQNVGMTILAGSSNVIEGTAKLVEPVSGVVVGDYDIARSTGGGGIIAAIGMSGAAEKMQAGFASELCEKAFGTQPRQ